MYTWYHAVYIAFKFVVIMYGCYVGHVSLVALLTSY